MKINIASSHRFHLLDLAIQLQKQGHDVEFYSYVPNGRCESYGLAPNTSHMMYFALPFLLLSKIVPSKYKYKITSIRNLLMDYYLAYFSRRCDVYICLGSVYLKSIVKAKNNGAITILEWGSKHIIEQRKQFGTLESYPSKQLQKDLCAFDVADYISVASNHVKQSFELHNLKKCIVNPYGVDLTQFYPTKCTEEYDVITVGGWRYEKGSDIIAKMAKKHPEISVLHVGALVNMEFPNLPNMHHVDSVDQRDLIKYYTKAKVFVLPSRADGFGMVLIQAVACGLPIVYSKETGGSTLKEMLTEKQFAISMDEFNEESLYCSICKAIVVAEKQKELRDYSIVDMENFSWNAYGKRYNSNLVRIINV